MRPLAGNQKRQAHHIGGFFVEPVTSSSIFEPPSLDNCFMAINHLIGGLMRNYTYLGGARFTVNNLFRSLRFDIDRLDMSWVDGEKPEFTRGLRIVDNDESNTLTVDGEDGDNLIYSLTYIFSKEDGVPGAFYIFTINLQRHLCRTHFCISIRAIQAV
jgi:hypothetical protein